MSHGFTFKPAGLSSKKADAGMVDRLKTSPRAVSDIAKRFSTKSSLRRSSSSSASSAAVKKATNTMLNRRRSKTAHNMSLLTNKKTTPPKGSMISSKALKPAATGGSNLKKSSSFSFGLSKTPEPQQKGPAPLSAAEVANQLRQLLGRTAATPYEKYLLLDERDKIIRIGRARSTDVDAATVSSGQCSDMCPEKERYHRQTQKRLYSYELNPINGEMDHRRTVKDYSRSSADQDTPLPHELRPSPVLSLTMDYLVSQIAREAPESDAELTKWYDFMWNTTRAIRKDITQQMLTDYMAVELMEKCVRFHVFAAHHLSHLDIVDFDQNMNSENLGKSLQSLRHLYEDLSKEGINCPNESEFRCYDILLNLTDSDILQQVLSYPASVRHSPEVHLALELFTSMQSNNYVRFFRTIRDSASYLQASVAHRFFPLVRRKALLIISKSYGQNFKMPVSDLVNMLGFENQIEALEFCACYGLRHSTNDGTMLVIARTAFGEPETQPEIKRAERLIGCKRVGCTLGELLSGGPVRDVELPDPVQSFDDYDCYNNDPVVAQYMSESLIDTPSNQAAIRLQMDEKNKNDSIIMQHLASLVAVDATVELIKTEAKKAVVDESTQALLNDSIREIISTQAAIIHEEQLKLQIQHQKQQHKMQLQTLVQETAVKCWETILEETMRSRLKEYCTAQILASRLLKRRSEMSEVCHKLETNLMESDLDAIIGDLCRELFEKIRKEREEKLDAIRDNLDKLWMRQFTDRWREYVEKRRRKRQDIEQFPIAPASDLLNSSRHLCASNCGLDLPMDLNKSLSSLSCTDWQWSVRCRFGAETVNKLMKIRKSMDTRRLEFTFERWRAQTRINCYRREAAENFPPCPVSLSESSLSLPPAKRQRLSFSSALESPSFTAAPVLNVSNISPIKLSPGIRASPSNSRHSFELEMKLEELQQEIRREANQLTHDEVYWNALLNDTF